MSVMAWVACSVVAGALVYGWGVGRSPWIRALGIVVMLGLSIVVIFAFIAISINGGD